ncbi:MAG: (Fe-S)-binding protein [Sulfurifustis sp.]
MSSPSPLRVGLFVTCLVDLVRPRIGFAALQLLEAAGCDITVPETQTCCGQPGYNAGDFAAARALALKLADEFERCDYVVVPSGSCAGMIRVHYPKLFESDATARERIRRLADRTFELTDFLVRIAKLDDAPGGGFDGRFTYHDACSGLRELGVKAQPRALLAKLPDATLVEMENTTTCCGFGGTFSNKYGEISARMAERKCAAIAKTGAGAVVAGDLGCLLNIEGRLRFMGDHTTRVLHVAEALTEAKHDAE